MGPVRSGDRLCQTRLIPRSPDGDNKHGADGIAETHDNGKDDDDSACQFVIVRVAGVARI